MSTFTRTRTSSTARPRSRFRMLWQGPAAGPVVVLALGAPALAGGGNQYFQPGNLVVSRSVYDNQASNVVAGVTVLPPNCTTGCVVAIADGTYPTVWNNDLADASFGITSKILLDQITPSSALVNTLEVPNSSQNGVPPTKDQMVTSFSSKSELA